MKARFFTVAVILGPFFGSCSATSGDASDEGGTDADEDGPGGDGDGDLILGDGDGDGDGDLDLSMQPAPSTCGDGVLDETEACDDTNKLSGDGCYENCLIVETGFICPNPGEPCQPFAKCGDGRVNFPEQCDDGDQEAGDGCSVLCKTEIGSKCSGEPSTCTATDCGDGLVEGAEGCDDENPVPFDGCNELCQWEPTCGVPGAEAGCSSFCGDGILWGDEECDDGNLTSGDGCSDECLEEEGYTCEVAPCEMQNGECVLRAAAVYRDFLDAHADFACGGGNLTLGLVEDELDEERKPVRTGTNGPCAGGSASIDSWYRDGADHSTIVSSIVLFEKSDGVYVNRFLPDGSPYENVNGDLIDGTPLFFPIDGFPLCGPGEVFGCALEDTLHKASIPGEPNTYEPGGWISETPALDHNFSFTTEVGYWFEYDGASPPVFDFLGDDDVWVFVNGKLALDLGGLHVPLARTLTLDAATNTELGLGLVSGNIYPITVFHAERNPTGSSFRVSLSGFRAERSICLSDCGDGVVAGSEECDDGINDGGHNECQPDCVLAAYCGDGKVQGDEQCDDNDPAAPENCSGCRLIVVR